MIQSNVLESQKSSTSTPEQPEQPDVGNEHQASPSPLPDSPEKLLPTLNDEEQETGGQAVSDDDALSSSEPSLPDNLSSEVVRLNVADIIVLDERRKFDNAKAPELKESIRRSGLINPITVRKTSSGYVLVAGARRLEALKQLGYTEIACIVLDCDELWSELVEIDENLMRNEITDPITLGELANRREEILDELGLRAKAGDNQHTMGGGADSAPPKTTAAIAKEAGIGERTMQVNKQLARDLIPEAKEVVRKKVITKALAVELSGLSEDQQRDVIGKGDKKAITVAICKIKAGDQLDDDDGGDEEEPCVVKNFLEKVRKTYKRYSEDKQEKLMAGLWEFMVEVDYIESDNDGPAEESDGEDEPEAEENTDGDDAVTSSENAPNKANESEG